MKLKDVFEKTVQFFKEKKIETARLDAELIIAHALRIDRLQIYLKYEQPLSESEVSLCRDFVRRRSLGEPVAYILGEKGFYGEIFSVGPGVLIPRPETELIVEQALDFAKNKDQLRVLDLGAGSGCIGLAILKNSLKTHPNTKLVSVEKSPEAFSYLQKNAELLGLAAASELILSDVRDLSYAEESFDVIVANPPYIASDDPLVESSVKKFEPEAALFSADRGLADIRTWSEHCLKLLNSPGLMLFEMGHSQGPEAEAHFRRLPGIKKTEILKDLAGFDRVIRAEK